MSNENDPQPGEGNVPKDQDPKPDKPSDDSQKPGDQDVDDHQDDLTPEQWDTAFKHPRFKKLNEKAKKAEEFERKEKEREEAEAKKRGEFDKLLTEKDAEIQRLQAADSERKVSDALRAAAIKAGAIDPDAAAALVSRKAIENDDEGNVTNADDVVSALLKDKPYLVGKKPDLGTPGNTGDGDGGQPEGKVWKRSEIREKSRNLAWYQEHKDELVKAQNEGRIEEDD